MSTEDARTDAELIDAARRGDAGAFEALYYRHRDWVMRIAYRFANHREDALEALLLLDEENRVLFALHYSREYDGESSVTTIRDSNGDISGTIEYRRENGRDVRRTEVFLLGSGRLEIAYTNFDSRGNWLRKEITTYNGATVKERTVTSRIIRYAR